MQKNEPGDKDYRVSSGEPITKKISELTGISIQTIEDNLDDEYMQVGEGKGHAPLFGEGRAVRVPRPLAESVREAIDELKQIVEENPNEQERILG